MQPLYDDSWVKSHFFKYTIFGVRVLSPALCKVHSKNTAIDAEFLFVIKDLETIFNNVNNK